MDAAAENKLCSYFEKATGGGLFPVVQYGVDLQANEFIVLTASIPDLPYALRVCETVLGKTYNLGQSTPPKRLQELRKENPHVFQIQEFTLPPVTAEDYPAIGQIAMRYGPARWAGKGIGLIDVCGFSQLSTDEQLQHLLSLDHVVRSAGGRAWKWCYNMDLGDSRWGRASTGDGYYLWNSDPSGRGHVVTFAWMVYAMAFAESLRQRRIMPMRLRAAYSVGETFTFYDAGLSSECLHGYEQALQNAVGPLTNDLARMAAIALPGQILIGDFSWSGKTQSMSPASVLKQINEQAFSADGATPADGGDGSYLAFDPPDTKLRFVDKHGEVRYCWNVVGRVVNRYASGKTALVPIGLSVDNTPELADTNFYSHPEA